MSVDTTEVIRLPVEGMTCAACIGAVSKALKAVPGVSDASVVLATSMATVWVEPAQCDEESLTAAITQAGFRVSSPDDREVEALIDLRLGIVLFLTTIALVLGMTPTVPKVLEGWGTAIVSLPVYIWAGAGIHRRTFSHLLHRSATMDTLVTLGTTASILWSSVALFLQDQPTYFETAAVIITLVLLGGRLETRARHRAGRALQALLDLTPRSVRLADNTEIQASELVVGDHFVVRPGERLVADGVVVEGEGAIDASMLTGESIPIDVSVGDQVHGGTLNTTSPIVVSATHVGEETAPARLAQMVAYAQASRPPVQNLVDRISAIFVPSVVVLSGATLAIWLSTNQTFGDAISAAVAVLIIACPCALGLAAPTVLQVATGRAAQMGIIIRSAKAIESARGIRTVAFDKTGTLTMGQMTVASTTAVEGWDPDEVLALAASLEQNSEHPIGQAIAASIIEPYVAQNVEIHTGFGISGSIGNRHVEVSRGNNKLPSPLSLSRDIAGATTVVVSVNKEPVGTVSLTDVIRPEAAAGVAKLQGLGIQVAMLTGDSEATARLVGEELGIKYVSSELSPEDKCREVVKLQGPQGRVAVVGDGLNDAPVLASADLGIAIGTGTDAALEAADIALVGNDLRGVADALNLCRRTLIAIKINLFWAFVYNLVAIPLAVSGALDPLVAAVAMVASSLFVVGNSLRLRSFGLYQSD